MLLFVCTCVLGTFQPKKLAKLLLFFELTKYFLEKMQKNFIFLQIVRFRWQFSPKFPRYNS